MVSALLRYKKLGGELTDEVHEKKKKPRMRSFNPEISKPI